MQKVISLLLVILIIISTCMINVSAAAGSSNVTVSYSHDANSSGYIEYLQGDLITFVGALYSGLRSNSVHACGLTEVSVAPGDLYKTSSVAGSIQMGKILYPAQFSYNSATWNMTMTLDTTNIPVGNYRFYFVAVWEDMGITAGYFYRDITILPAEKPSTWAEAQVNTAISKYLIPQEYQNRYTSSAKRIDFSELITNLIEVKTGMLIDGYLGRKGLDTVTNPFSDTSSTDVVAANKLGIISGKGNGLFDPSGGLTREEAATMIWRAAVALGLDASGTSTAFADKNNISEWAREAVAYVSSKGIMTGTGNNNFSPKDAYTYEQCYISLLRFYDSMSGVKIDTSPIKPNTAEPKAMSVPFTSAGCSYTVVSSAIDGDITPGNITANDNSFVVRFTADNPPTFPQVSALGNQAYLLTPGGTIYYSTYYSSWDETYKTCLLGFAIPKSIDVSTLTLVCNGEWRRLDGIAVIPSLPTAQSKPMSTPIKLSDSLSVVITKAAIGDAISGQTTEQNAFYLVFEPQKDVYSSSQYSSLYSTGYLLAPDGKQYRYASTDYKLGEPYVITYLIPKSIDISTLLFVLGDEVRSLK